VLKKRQRKKDEGINLLNKSSTPLISEIKVVMKTVKKIP
jgi:hypothetical protein